MKTSLLKVFCISILCLLLIATTSLAGEGLYPSPSTDNVVLPSDEVAPIEKDGQTYYWNEYLGEYISERDMQNDMADGLSIDRELDMKKLQQAPSKEDSVDGVVKEDTYIYSGPSTPSKIFEDNGIMTGGTVIHIFHEEDGYYFIESKEDGVRGYLPIKTVSITDASKPIIQRNMIAAAIAVNELGATKKNGINGFVVYN